MIAYILVALLVISVGAIIILKQIQNKQQKGDKKMANEVEEVEYKDVIKPDDKPNEGKDTHEDAKHDDNEDPIEKFARETAKKNNGGKNGGKDDDATSAISSLSDDDVARIVEAVSTKMTESENEKRKSSSAAAEAIMASISNATPKKVDPWEAATRAINARLGGK